ncbi:hypothetical protein TPA0908_39260 [Micromonospora sp. AKA38]|nr:hypothetical protein TPA0908_39260 [Micromonospora sp. AKA38]
MIEAGIRVDRVEQAQGITAVLQVDAGRRAGYRPVTALRQPYGLTAFRAGTCLGPPRVGWCGNTDLRAADEPTGNLDTAAGEGIASLLRELNTAGTTAVRDVLAVTANPAAPYEVVVSRPSDALTAKRATERAFNGLLLGLGAVALLVGGVGIANIMIISVLERRAEIGLRRALGATRGQIRLQFLTESLLLSTLSGSAGAVLGAAITITYASLQQWPPVTPGWAIVAGIGSTITIGAVAGIYPAVRAARMPPTEALGSG